MDWNTELIEFLELIRRKSVSLAQKHTSSFFYYKRCTNMFDVPVIILSVLSSSISVGVSNFVSQPDISLTTCSISMLIAILGSVKLYLNLTSNMTNELEISKEFHILALDISKTLFIPADLRKIDQIEFLNKMYDTYIVLLQKSSLIQADEEKSQLERRLEKLQGSPKTPSILQSRLKNPLTVTTIG